MTVYVSEAPDNGELIRQGGATLGRGIGQQMEKDAAYKQRVNPLVESELNKAAGNDGDAPDGTAGADKDHVAMAAHPVLKKMLMKYGAALANGTITAEEVHSETAKELRLYAQQTAPVSGASLGEVPVSQPPGGDVPEKVVSVPSQQSPQYNGRQGQTDEGSDHGSFPSQQPGTGPSLGTPMQQANGVASQVMGGGQKPPQVGRPESVASLGAGPATTSTSSSPPPEGPTLNQPRHAEPVKKANVPVYERELGQFKDVTSFIATKQKPELENIKADAKVKSAKAVNDAKMELQMFKERHADNRTVAKLDTALQVAQGRLDGDGQQRVAHMTEALINVEGKLESVRELIAQRQQHDQGDWKLKMNVAVMQLNAALGKNAAMLANSNNLIIDDKVQSMLDDTNIAQQEAAKSFNEISQEIGKERNSPAVENVGKPGVPNAPADVASPPKVPNLNAEPKKPDAPKKPKKKVTEKAKSLLEEMYGGKK